MMSFEPLWKTMKEKDISVYTLLDVYNFSHGTYDRIKKNRNVTLNTLDQLCKMLDCRVEDIIEYKKGRRMKGTVGRKGSSFFVLFNVFSNLV